MLILHNFVDCASLVSRIIVQRFSEKPEATFNGKSNYFLKALDSGYLYVYYSRYRKDCNYNFSKEVVIFTV